MKTSIEITRVLVSMPFGYHVSTIGSPTPNPNNDKMHANEDADNSHEKEIDNVDILVDEKHYFLGLSYHSTSISASL